MTVFKLRMYVDLVSLVSLKPRGCALVCLFTSASPHGGGHAAAEGDGDGALSGRELRGEAVKRPDERVTVAKKQTATQEKQIPRDAGTHTCKVKPRSNAKNRNCLKRRSPWPPESAPATGRASVEDVRAAPVGSGCGVPTVQGPRPAVPPPGNRGWRAVGLSVLFPATSCESAGVSEHV